MRYVKLILTALVGAAVLVASIAWHLRPGQAPKFASLRSPYRTEEDFLLKTVIGDVAGMVSVAAKKWDGRSQPKVTINTGNADSALVTVDFKGGRASETLVLQSIWSAAQYDGRDPGGPARRHTPHSWRLPAPRPALLAGAGRDCRGAARARDPVRRRANSAQRA